MINFKKIATAATLGLAFAVCHANDSHPLLEPPKGFYVPAENLITGGQPSKSDFLQLKNAGVTKVINLRAPAEDIDFNEQQQAEALGLEYVSLPVAGVADITLENAEKLHTLLADDQKVFLHCASGNRVGALLAIRAHAFQGQSADASLGVGRAAGLGSLEEKVKSVIESMQ